MKMDLNYIVSANKAWQQITEQTKKDMGLIEGINNEYR